MKALTVYEPWASLIVLGAKPYEFRRWDYSARFPSIVGQRIAIHASSRKVVAAEVFDILDRIDDGESALDVAITEPFLRRLLEHDELNPAGGQSGRVRKHIEIPLPLSAVIGTAIIGKPVRAFDLFKDKVADSSRLDQHIFAWPLTEVVRFDGPVPYRGAQGFWNFPEGLCP